MKKRIFKQTVSVVLAAALVVGIAVPERGEADARSKTKTVKLNTKSVSISVGKTTTIQVKNNKKKAVWSIKSGKKIVELIKKKKSRVVVKGRKAGTAVIYAKVDGRKLRCKVKVKKANKVDVTPALATPASSDVPAAVGTPVPTEVVPTEAVPTEAVPTEAAATPTPNPTYAPEKFSYAGLDTSWIAPEKPMVAFTFDDGPIGNADTDNSMVIQSALKKYGAHATFFYIGGQINSEQREEEIRQAVANGFEIGNHSWAWDSMSSMKEAKIKKSIEDTNAKLSELSNYHNFLFRAPNLRISDTMKGYIKAPFINCSIDSKDWDNATTEQIIQNVQNAKDGDIVLMHETQKNTAAAIEQLLEYFTAKGWQIVSVSELFAVRNKELTTGKVYERCPG